MSLDKPGYQGRTVELLDVLLNTGGGFLAAIVAVRVLRMVAGGWSLVGPTVGAVFVAVLVFLSGTGHAATRMLRLSDWNWVEYSIVAGDEVGGERRYVGTVRDPLIRGGFPESEVCTAPGATLEAREMLSRAALGSQRVRLAAVVRSNSDAQSGPTRIVSFSGSVNHRNATLGQEGRSLHLRLRTRGSGPNGMRPVFVLREAILTGLETRIEAKYRPGRVSLSSKTETASTEAVYRWGYLSGWGMLTRREISHPWALIFMAIVAGAALSLPLGILAAALPVAFSRGRLPLALIGPPLILTAVVWPLGDPIAVHELVLCGASGLAGLVVGRSGRRRPARLVDARTEPASIQRRWSGKGRIMSPGVNR